MPQDAPPIIADRSWRVGAFGAFWIVFVLAIVTGAAAAVYYARLDLTLSHYDARAHVVVARRVIDSLTPGWRQLGGVWLPLPHIINSLPVQWDWAYRTGAVPVGVSVVALAWGLAAFGRYVYERVGSLAAALSGPLLILANPNVLFLQSTPMTEPLLMGLALGAVTSMDRWMRSPTAPTARMAGAWLAALVLVRYEGWVMAGGLLAVASLTSVRSLRKFELRRSNFDVVDRRLLPIWIPPLAAIAAFLVLSRASTGQWLVTSGFFVPENPSLHKPWAALDEVWASTVALAGPVIVAAGAVGAVGCLWRARASTATLLPLALVCAAWLPLAAFYSGHPHRVRYMVPLVAAAGALASLAPAWLPARLRASAALALLAAALVVRPPLSGTAPMVVEAQWETPFRLARRDVTRTLAGVYDGTPILASMGSLAHYMHESSSVGLHLRNFLHEGNGDLWADALASPRRHVRWVLIEERAEGGDTLAMRAREHPNFLAGFVRIAEGGGLVLYRRTQLK